MYRVFNALNIRHKFTKCSTFHADSNHRERVRQSERERAKKALRFINTKLNLAVGRRVNFGNDNAFVSPNTIAVGCGCCCCF